MGASKEETKRFFAQPCDFVLAASVPEHFDSLPRALPEVAFWGRSNVGKSSLINATVNRKKLARASNTPGRTRQIVFFDLAGKIMFADLPGYGHAKAPKEEIARWNGLIDRYLKTRARLRCVFLLIDGRHGILEKDERAMDRLDKLAVGYQVVFTKADRIKDGELKTRLAAAEKALRKHPAARPGIVLTSAESKQGVDELQVLLREVAAI